MIKKTILTWCLSSLFLVGVAQDVITSEKSVERSFAVSKGDRLEVENKYGEVIIEPAPGNELKIKVEISLTAGNYSAIQELEDYVEVEIDRTGSFILAETHWGRSSGFFAKSWSEIKNAFDGDRSIEVNYTIEAPNFLDVNVINKFGDVFVGEFGGRLGLDLAHGDLRGRRIAKPDRVKVSYGRVVVEEWGKGKVEVYFAEMESDKADDLTVNSRNSEIILREAENLVVDSKNDEWQLGRIRSIKGTFSFTSAKVDFLEQDAGLHQDYGDLRIEHLGPDFKDIVLTMKKSDVSILVDEQTEFNFSVYLKNGETFSSVPSLVTLERDQQVGDERQMEGYWKAQNYNRNLTIRGESAVVKLGKR